MKKIKTLLGIFLTITASFCMMCTVFAETLSIDDIIDKFKETGSYQMFYDEETGKGMTVTKDATAKTITFHTDSEEEGTDDYDLVLTYTDEYILLDKRDVTITLDNCMTYFVDAIVYEGLVESMLELSGIKNKTIDIEEYDNNYDKYGLEVQLAEYDFEGEGYSIKGTGAKYVKMSLDKSKITELAKDYGEDYITDDLSKVKPTLTVVEKTDKQVKIKIDLGLSDEVVQRNYITYKILRSESKDGEFEEIKFDWYDGVETYIDTDIEAGKTYYYKVTTNINELESNVLSSDDLKESEKENPNTGMIVPISVIGIGAVLAIAGLSLSKKKSRFN